MPGPKKNKLPLTQSVKMQHASAFKIQRVHDAFENYAWYHYARETAIALGVTEAAKYIKNRYKMAKRKSSIASNYFRKKRRVERRGRGRGRVAGMRARGAKSGKNVSWRSSRLQLRKRIQNKLCVGDKVPKYISRVYGGRIATSANTKTWHILTDYTLGLHEIGTLDDIYTKEAFTDADQHVVILNQKVKVRVKNQSDMGCYITMYEIKLKTDWASSALGTIGSSALNNGFLKVGLAQNSEQPCGVELYQNPTFFRYFRILKRRKIYLAPGQVTTYVLQSLNIHKRSFVYKHETALTDLKGSVFLMSECEGVPVHDSTTASEIGTSTVSCDYWLTKNTTYKTPNSGTITVDHDYNSTLPQIGAIGFVDGDIVEQAQEV